jgi:hypothetical protein
VVTHCLNSYIALEAICTRHLPPGSKKKTTNRRIEH